MKGNRRSPENLNGKTKSQLMQIIYGLEDNIAQRDDQLRGLIDAHDNYKHHCNLLVYAANDDPDADGSNRGVVMQAVGEIIEARKVLEGKET